MSVLKRGEGEAWIPEWVLRGGIVQWNLESQEQGNQGTDSRWRFPDSWN